MSSLLFILIFTSVLLLIYTLVVEILNLTKNTFGRNKIPFTLISLNIIILLTRSIVLLTSNNTIMLTVFSEIIASSIVIMPAIIFHFTIQLTNDTIKQIQKTFIKVFYSISLILSISLIIFDMVSIQKISYGYTFNVPSLLFIQLFFITPLNLLTIYIVINKIYQNIKKSKSVIALSILLVGFTLNFAGQVALDNLLNNGTTQSLLITRAPDFILYLLISLVMLTSNYKIWRITEERIFRSMEDAVFAIENAGHIVKINNSGYGILEFNENAEDKGKINLKYILDKISSLIVNSRQRKKFIDALSNTKFNTYKEDIELTINNKKEYYRIKITPILDNFKRVLGKLLILTNITAIKEKENQLYFQSYHDKLTGIYNRLYFEEELSRLNTRRQFPLSIIIGDVNGLKLINDAYGHDKGDEVLKNIAVLLKKNLRHEDILSRWGGDEFAIILPKTDKANVVKIIDRIKESFIEHSTITIPLNISMGFSVKNNTRKKINDMIKNAEDIMNEYKLLENESARSSIILSLKKALEERDYETEEHAMRMANLSSLLGKKLKFNYNELNELRLLAILHDIGKISISDNIILKPDKLTPEEWEIIKKHPEVGYRLAKSSRDLEQIAVGILHHHERWDGKGYPEGIKGKKIPVISRIVSIADAFDAMTNDRPYRKALSRDEAIEEIKREAGSQFDPTLAKLFIEILKSDNKSEAEA
jgi:diguanylate cyclase (GGDEF)-like protein